MRIYWIVFQTIRVFEVPSLGGDLGEVLKKGRS